MSRISVALNVLPRNVKVNTLRRARVRVRRFVPTLLAPRNGWLRVNLRDSASLFLGKMLFLPPFSSFFF